MNKSEEQCQAEILEVTIAYCEKSMAECCQKAVTLRNRKFYIQAGCWLDLLRQKTYELEQLQKREPKIFGRLFQ